MSDHSHCGCHEHSHPSHQHGHCHCHCCCCHHHCDCCKAHSEHHKKYFEELIDLADTAWMDVLKEKIAYHIRQKADNYLNELARMVSEANHLRWKHKMQEKKSVEDFEEHLRSVLYKDQEK